MVCHFHWWSYKNVLVVSFEGKIKGLENFEKFYQITHTQFETKIKILRTDIGREYFNTVLGSYFSKHGIVHQSSCPDTPQQKGVVKSKNRHLLKVARSIMFTTHILKQFWEKAILTVAYLINRMPSQVLYHLYQLVSFKKVSLKSDLCPPFQ